MTEPLFDVVVVHCFFQCPTTATGTDPQAVHDAMEQHYQVCHSADLDRVLPTLTPEQPR